MSLGDSIWKWKDDPPTISAGLGYLVCAEGMKCSALARHLAPPPHQRALSGREPYAECKPRAAPWAVIGRPFRPEPRNGMARAKAFGSRRMSSQRVWLAAFPFRFKGGEAAFARIVDFVEEE